MTEPLISPLNPELQLAPFAQLSANSRGRLHPESGAGDIRTAFQRDRDRIVHSAAFRRLAYKTQVFVNHEGDYYRSRLTHTLEVAQVGRTIARALRLNEDLTEAIILAHDLGHTAFGHAGQEILNGLMKGHGGFEHNRQSLRIVDVLERRYAGFRGLNLSFETRESILKHKHPKIREKLGFDTDLQPCLEAQLADLSDSLAYDQHDVDDALKAGIVHWEELKDLRLWHRAEAHVEEVCARAGPIDASDKRVKRREAVRYLISIMVMDVIQASAKALSGNNISSVSEARAHKTRLICLSDELADEKREFQRFLHQNVYSHYRMRRNAGKARRFLTTLFEEFVTYPEQLPDEYRDWVERVGIERGVCDYISGMTDRFVQREYQKLTKPFYRT